MSKISCVISVYNANKEYLKEQINSIRDQSLSDFELLIADDGNNKFNLEEFISSFNDKRFKYFNNETNLGASESTNRLLSKATGDYIALCDSDDIDNIYRFSVESTELDNNPKLDMVSGKIKIFGATRERIDGTPMQPKQVSEELLFWTPIKNPTTMIRRSSVEKHNIHFSSNYKVAYDYEMYSFNRKLNHLIIDKVVKKYRKHNSNITTDKNLTRDEHWRITQRNLFTIGLDFPKELCQMLDPYNNNKHSKLFIDMFKSSRDTLCKEISEELYTRKLMEIMKKGE